MATFDFEKDFYCLYVNANKLCNTIDSATAASKRALNGCDHQGNIAVGKMSEAFFLIADARKLLHEAAETLNEKKDCVNELKNK